MFLFNSWSEGQRRTTWEEEKEKAKRLSGNERNGDWTTGRILTLKKELVFKEKITTDTQHNTAEPLLMLAIMLETALRRNYWVKKTADLRTLS